MGFNEGLSIRKKGLRKKLSVVEGLVFVLPFFVTTYVFQEEGVFERLQPAHAVLFIFVLLTVLGGVLILRKVFDEFEMVAVIARKPAVERKNEGEVFFRSDTAELREIAGAFDQILRELSERKKRLIEQDDELEAARADVLHMNRLSHLGEVAAAMVHEISQPLNVIGLSAQSVMADEKKGIIPPLHPVMREGLARMESQTYKAREIIERVMSYAHAGRAEEPRPVDVSEPLDGALSLAGRLLELRNIRLVLDLAPGLPKVMAEPGRLEQVFLNLIANAKDAMEEGDGPKVLTIRSARGGGGEIVMEFRDTGGGVAEDIRDRIFNPFFTTKPAGRGTGLGLSISRDIIREHGGEFGLEVEDGIGSSFMVKLPAAFNPGGEA